MYLDDIIFHRYSLAEHVVHVREVLTSLSERGPKAKCGPCAWVYQKVDISGIDIDKDCINAQEHKTNAVMDWPQPENSKDVRGFMGLTSYCRKFFEHYAHIAMRLYAIGNPAIGQGNVGRQRGEPRNGPVHSIRLGQ